MERIEGAVQSKSEASISYKVDTIFSELYTGEKKLEDIEPDLLYIEGLSPTEVSEIIEQAFLDAVRAHDEVNRLALSNEVDDVEYQEQLDRAVRLSRIAAMIGYDNRQVDNLLVRRGQVSGSLKVETGGHYHQMVIEFAKRDTHGAFPLEAVQAHELFAYEDVDVQEYHISRRRRMVQAASAVTAGVVLSATLPGGVAADEGVISSDISIDGYEVVVNSDSIVAFDDLTFDGEPESVFGSNEAEVSFEDTAQPFDVDASELEGESILDSAPTPLEDPEVESEFMDSEETPVTEPAPQLPSEVPVAPPEAPAPAVPETPAPEVEQQDADVEAKKQEARRAALRTEIHEKVSLGAYGQPIEADRLYNILMDRAAHYNHPTITSGLVTALLYEESKFDLVVNSPGVGAQGIGQFMPETAAQYGIDPYNPEQAIDATFKYLTSSYDQLQAGSPGASYDELIAWTLASYNAGMGNVLAYGGVPPFKETIDYVHRITGHVGEIQAEMDRAVQQVSPQAASVNELSVQTTSVVDTAYPVSERVAAGRQEALQFEANEWSKAENSIRFMLENTDLSPTAITALVGNLLYDTKTSAQDSEGFCLRQGALRSRIDRHTEASGEQLKTIEDQVQFIIEDLKNHGAVACARIEKAAAVGLDEASVSVQKDYLKPFLSNDKERIQETRRLQSLLSPTQGVYAISNKRLG